MILMKIKGSYKDNQKNEMTQSHEMSLTRE